MASISKDKNGTKRIVYYNADKKQVSMRLGKIPMKMAETIKVHVENLLSAQAMNVSVGSVTARWLTEIPDQLHQKFAQKGFASPRKTVGTLGEVIPKIITEKTKSVDAKPATIAIWKQAEESLYRYFGKDRQVNKITKEEAKEFSLWLAKHGRLKDKGTLKLSTVYKRVQHVIAFFQVLIEKGDISKNPFAKLGKRPAVDSARNKYIDAETIFKVMDYAPDAEWRLIIALWRFAGLRAVSEVLTLKWEDILWDQKKIVVTSPKTEHHQGKEMRIIPFFPHLEKYLTEAFEQAEERAIFVVEKHAPLHLRGKKERINVSGQGNLGTVFAKIIRRAGVVRWKKLLHNLRASFETDLLNGKYGQFGLHTIAGWLGHSVKVMLEHYGRIQQSDFDQIEQACLQVEQQANLTAEKASLNPSTAPTQNDDFVVENTAQNLLQKASLNASLYTAILGVNERQGAETPPSSVPAQTLASIAFSGKKWKGASPNGNPNILFTGGGGN